MVWLIYGLFMPLVWVMYGYTLNDITITQQT